jgi:predicted dehydrogenase
MRIGLLGTGPWAGIAHAPALQAHPGTEFAGVWGRRPEAAEALAAAHGTRAFTDPDALIDAVDAVAIALPPAVQAPLAARAARAGKHLLLDKPLALDPAAAREVADAVRAAGVASVVFFTARFHPAVEGWFAERAARDDWFTASALWFGSVFGDDTEGPASPFATPWRRDKGALWDVGPHAVSSLLAVLGDVETGGPGAPVAARGPGDTVHLVLRHTAGASSTLALSLTAPRAAGGSGVEVRGPGGVHRLEVGDGDGAVAAFGRAIDALGTAASGGPAHPCDAAFGARVTEILAAAAEALPALPEG